MNYYKNVRRVMSLAMAGALMSLWGCEQVEEDVIPLTFQEISLYPDEVYMYNRNDEVLSTDLYRILLTPLVNDSLKTKATLKFGQPLHGQLSADCWGESGSTCYQPNDDFYGVDSLTYTVCNDAICKTETIRIVVEMSPDPDNCILSVGADSLVTKMDMPAEIKIFANDEFCTQLPYAPVTQNPAHGKLRFYDYMGNYKSTTFIYYPDKGFVGEDYFVYKVDWFTKEADYVRVKITVKAQ